MREAGVKPTLEGRAGEKEELIFIGEMSIWMVKCSKLLEIFAFPWEPARPG
jgi:hypothetical protein